MDASADAEVEHAYNEYAKQNVRAALGFLDALDAALLRLAEGPETFPRYDGEVRRCLLAKYPYGIVFEVIDDVVFVVAVAHLKRRPGYWK
jgi:toxin ParE1/3/4